MKSKSSYFKLDEAMNLSLGISSRRYFFLTTLWDASRSYVVDSGELFSVFLIWWTTNQPRSSTSPKAHIPEKTKFISLMNRHFQRKNRAPFLEIISETSSVLFLIKTILTPSNNRCHLHNPHLWSLLKIPCLNNKAMDGWAPQPT